MADSKFGLSELLERHGEGTEPDRLAEVMRQAPKGLVAGHTIEDGKGEATTRPFTEGQEADARTMLESSGLDPDEWEIVPPVRTSNWDAQVKGEGVKRLTSYRFNVVAKGERGARVEMIDKLIRDAFENPVAVTVEHRDPNDDPDTPIVIAHGDWQIGKMDGDGPEGTVARIIESINKATSMAAGHHWAHVAVLGDCLEGFVSQGGKNAWRTTLDLNEQIRIVRRLLALQIRNLAQVCGKVTVAVVDGNHDEALREPVKTTHGSGHLTEIAIALQEMFDEMGDTYSHVTIYVPEREELSVTVDVGEARILHTHGHLWRKGKHWEWWQGQAFDRSTTDRWHADILLCGHTHAFHLEMRGDRTFMVVPAQERESTWWKLRTGMTGYPGALVFSLKGKTGYGYTIV